jgi:hypothetical protein
MNAVGPARAAVTLLAMLHAGCASRGPALPSAAEAGVTARVELEQTPFFPQDKYECGPAALATVLAASGLGVAPDDIAPEVYLPGRRGSLQPELLASVRRHGRLPYVLPGSLDAIVRQVAAGSPVLVLQKLGAGPWPGWHYAVVIGYDLDTGYLRLRSGTDRRLRMSVSRFMMIWGRAGLWAMVAVRPGDMPASPDLGRYMEAAASLESIGEIDAAREAYLAAARRWPNDALPRIALGNVALARGELQIAERAYEDALRLDGRNVAARNNLAEVLLRRGCPMAARAEIDLAARLAAGGQYATAVADTAAKIASVQGPDNSSCPVPAAGSGLPP